jgi:hypothetical protein
MSVFFKTYREGVLTVVQYTNQYLVTENDRKEIVLMNPKSVFTQTPPTFSTNSLGHLYYPDNSDFAKGYEVYGKYLLFGNHAIFLNKNIYYDYFKSNNLIIKKSRSLNKNVNTLKALKGKDVLIIHGDRMFGVSAILSGDSGVYRDYGVISDCDYSKLSMKAEQGGMYGFNVSSVRQIIYAKGK